MNSLFRPKLSVGFLLLLAPAQAHAQETIAIVPAVGGDRSIPAQIREQAVQDLSAALAAQGYRVQTPAQVERQLPSNLRNCSSTSCGKEVAARLHTSYAAALTMWSSSDDRAIPRQIVVGLVDPQGTAFKSTKDVTRSNVRAAIAAALTEIKTNLVLGPGPWLFIEGDPLGARVVIDGRDVGDLPYRGKIAPGTHQVLVRFRGYQTHSQTIQVSGDTAARITLENIHLRRPGEPPASATRVSRRPADRAVIGPLILGSVGVVAATVGAVSMLPETCDKKDPTGECLEGYRSRTAVNVTLLAGGGLAIAGALLWYFLSGENSTASESQTPSVSLGPTSVSLTGKF